MLRGQKMREILFRAKILATESVWVEGFYNHIPCGRFQCDEHLIQTIDENGRIGRLFTVYKSTLGQFTGLTDKNGKKIFEGDILEFRRGRTHTVKFEDGAYIFTGTAIPVRYADKFEVIGNIHDNPELLGVEDDN